MSEVGMDLTLKLKLKLCWEILTAKSGHNHPPDIKQLSTFIEGYTAGYKDCFLDCSIKRDDRGRVSINHQTQ